jgi:RNA polymerase sigma-70 factor (ECF subfamily)
MEHDGGLDRYRDELLAHAARRLGDINQAEDATQEALLRAYRNAETFGNHPNPRAYLLLALRHAIISQWRAEQRTCQPEGGLDGLPDRRSLANPQEALIVREAVAALPAQQRRAMELHMEGHEADDIARLMKVTVQAVYRLIYRARERLRQLLDHPPTRQKSGRRATD